MTQFLPAPLIALFAARDPLPFLPPPQPLPHEKRTTGYTGVGQFVKFFETEQPPPPPKYETRDERRARKHADKQERVAYKLEKEIAIRNPAANEKATTDPFKTVFVGRLNYETTESKLKREFEAYGPIKKVIMVKDKKTSLSRGYAFIEFEVEKDMRNAYKCADGRKLNGRRIVVDFERGRADKAWLPRRLGGGIGGTRRGGPETSAKYSGRDGGSSLDENGGIRSERRSDRSRERNSDYGRRRITRSRSRSRDRRRDRADRRGNSGDRIARVARNRDLVKTEFESHKRSRRDEDVSRRRDESPDKKRRRSRSSDKKNERKDKERGDRDKPRAKHRERSHRSEKQRTTRKESGVDVEPANTVRIKEEPKDDDYPSSSREEQSNGLTHVKQEYNDDEENICNFILH